MQVGLEETPDAYVQRLVEIFREVKRVLRDDGTLWLNLGDTYASVPGSAGTQGKGGEMATRRVSQVRDNKTRHADVRRPPGVVGVKPKDLLGIPWMVAFALRADGWYLRSDIIWAKPNPMPESVLDRPTSAHEHVFLLSKMGRYYYDADAIRETSDRSTSGNKTRFVATEGERDRLNTHLGSSVPWDNDGRGRNRRNVWEVSTKPYPEAHFATFPPKLIEPMILAGAAPQTCAECGAPWERTAERMRCFDGEPVEDTGAWSGPDAPRRMNDGRGHYRWSTISETTGWRPTCDHADGGGAFGGT